MLYLVKFDAEIQYPDGCSHIEHRFELMTEEILKKSKDFMNDLVDIENEEHPDGDHLTYFFLSDDVMEFYHHGTILKNLEEAEEIDEDSPLIKFFNFPTEDSTHIVFDIFADTCDDAEHINLVESFKDEDFIVKTGENKVEKDNHMEKDNLIKPEEFKNYSADDILFGYVNDKASAFFFKDGKEFWLVDDDMEEMSEEEFEEACEDANDLIESVSEGTFVKCLNDSGNGCFVSEEALEKKLFTMKHIAGIIDIWSITVNGDYTKDEIYSTTDFKEAYQTASKFKLEIEEEDKDESED